MQGIAGLSREVTPTRQVDAASASEIAAKRSQIKELSDFNREVLSQKTRQETLLEFAEKKKREKLRKYLTDRDTLAALAL